MNKMYGGRFAAIMCTCAISMCLFAEQSFPSNGTPKAGSQQAPAKSRPAGVPVESVGANKNARTSESADTPAAADSSYVIGAADILSIQVWHEPDLSAQSLPVRPDGKISLALLNDVQAAGLTPMQLGQEITADLKRYVSDPQVTVVVDAINSKRIYVVGQVTRPGAYPLLPEMNVLQALSSAGGFPQFANPKKIYVLRGSKKLPFSYKRALKGEYLDREIVLQPGDTIVVP